MIKAMKRVKQLNMIIIDLECQFQTRTDPSTGRQDNNLPNKSEGCNYIYNWIEWIECFLKNRKQTVVVDGVKSTFEEVESGVPQGTVLGPVFFIVYVIDLVLRVKSSKMLTFLSLSLNGCRCRPYLKKSFLTGSPESNPC